MRAHRLHMLESLASPTGHHGCAACLVAAAATGLPSSPLSPFTIVLIAVAFVTSPTPWPARLVATAGRTDEPDRKKDGEELWALRRFRLVIGAATAARPYHMEHSTMQHPGSAQEPGPFSRVRRMPVAAAHALLPWRS